MTVQGFCGPPGNWFFGVFDGHGSHGHLVSDYVSRNLAQKLYDLVQNYAKAKFLLPSTHSKETPSGLNKKKILDIGQLDEAAVKTIHCETYS